MPGSRSGREELAVRWARKPQPRAPAHPVLPSSLMPTQSSLPAPFPHPPSPTFQPPPTQSCPPALSQLTPGPSRQVPPSLSLGPHSLWVTLRMCSAGPGHLPTLVPGTPPSGLVQQQSPAPHCLLHPTLPEWRPDIPSQWAPRAP